MPCETCDFCGQPIERIDFYLTFKSGNICPSCVVLSRAVDDGGRQEPDGRQPFDTIPMVATSPERQLFF